MRQLAEKMHVAPESLSRAINGNPQLSTLYSIAQNLDVSIEALFETKVVHSELAAMVRFRDKTIATTDINVLYECVERIREILQKENREVQENKEGISNKGNVV